MKDSTPLSEQFRIVLFGVRNSGKSSLMNNLFERQVSIISEVPGTTTDPVTKSMELSGLGPVAVTDTAGLDDTGDLGKLRIDRSLESLAGADIPVLITRANALPAVEEEEISDKLNARRKNWVLAVTFSDKKMLPQKKEWLEKINSSYVLIDNIKKKGVPELKQMLIQYAKLLEPEMTPAEGLVEENNLVILVTPIDLAAPKGRLILPQVETIRDLLDKDCAALVVKERELKYFYDGLKKRPRLVITDSQVFNKVAADIPPDQPMTSFSILFARKKWDLAYFVKSLAALKSAPPDIKVIIFEACSHHRQADDIGSVKIPRLFRQLIQPRAEFELVHALPDESKLKDYYMVIACGGCMAARNALMRQLDLLKQNGIYAVNYGLFLAYVNGLLPRALEPFPFEHELYTKIK